LLALDYWLVIVRPRQCAPGELCHVDSPTMGFTRRAFWLSVAVYLFALALGYGAELWLRFQE
jgi:hypothetical protein